MALVAEDIGARVLAQVAPDRIVDAIVGEFTPSGACVLLKPCVLVCPSQPVMWVKADVEILEKWGGAPPPETPLSTSRTRHGKREAVEA